MKIKRMIFSIAILCTFLCASAAYAQEMTVSGIVKESSGEVLVGVSIVKKGTTTGTMTDVDGKYSISAKKGDMLEFSYVGFESKTIKVTSSKLNVTLKENLQMLDEMVVLGYAMQESHYYAADKADYSVMSRRPSPIRQVQNTESYKTFTSNKFKDVSNDPLSTFSIDVDKASYSNLRRFLNEGKMPPADAIRVEELINYFSYNYDAPTGKDPVKFHTEVGECPWDKNNRLVKIGLKAREIDKKDLPAANLVFLIDVSGSMYWDNRMDHVKSSMNLLIDQMRPEDRVAIVTYASGTKVQLESTSGKEKDKIRGVLNSLQAGGSTAGAAGINLAYDTAEKYLIKKGNNRVILCTDGDFNVGVSNRDDLKKLIEEKRKTGVFLSVLGFGMGNYKDDVMQSLAEAGNGNHAYINDMQEAKKVLVNEFGGTMYTIAKDVKLQVEFNPLKVKSYRLVGYESRLLENEDFNDDAKDAGDMGVGHTVTAFYEIVPANGKDKKEKKNEKEKDIVDPLKYQTSTPTGSDELITVKMRYKDPDSEESKLLSAVVVDNGGNDVSEDFRFASAVAFYGKMLHDEEKYDASLLKKVADQASKAYGEDEEGYRREFVRLVKLTESIAR